MLGKQRKTLPPIGADVHLRDFGYSVHKSQGSRRRSLKKASKKHGSLTVLRHINLIRNYTSKKRSKKNKAILTKDVDYMKKEYAKQKKTSRKKTSRKKKN